MIFCYCKILYFTADYLCLSVISMVPKSFVNGYVFGKFFVCYGAGRSVPNCCVMVRADLCQIVLIDTQGRYKSLFFRTGETPVLEEADETCLPSGMVSALPGNAEFITSYSIITELLFQIINLFRGESPAIETRRGDQTFKIGISTSERVNIGADTIGLRAFDGGIG